MSPATAVSSSTMISSDKVAGTEVYAADGKHIGEIDYLVIEKVSGRVAYAVMTFGGFLGMGKDQYPIPWGMLKYDTSLGGYHTTLTKEQVEGAPQAIETDTRAWDNSEWNTKVHSYYGVPPYY
ncbi:MAG TPA: PRC-barrel domain-containing protein [Burkholderiaceae bacterium]|nr:PRC-barrel domain-containing protein [Burkholderiaceae bacterium]